MNTEIIKNTPLSDKQALELQNTLNSMIKKVFPNRIAKFEIYTDHNGFLVIKLDYF